MALSLCLTAAAFLPSPTTPLLAPVPARSAAASVRNTLPSSFTYPNSSLDLTVASTYRRAVHRDRATAQSATLTLPLEASGRQDRRGALLVVRRLLCLLLRAARLPVRSVPAG